MVLLVVLVALALLAGLAVAATRLSRSELTALSAERAVFQRENLLLSALAALGPRLASDAPPPRNGTPDRLDLPGGSVGLQLQAAAGLVNPNSTREPALLAALVSLGAQPQAAARIVNAIMARRAAFPGQAAFRDRSAIAALVGDDPGLWSRLAPVLTLLGHARDIDPATAPKALRAAAARAQAGFDLGAIPSRLEREALFEVWLRLPAGAGGAVQVVHASILLDRDGAVHVLGVDWPEAEPR